VELKFVGWQPSARRNGRHVNRRRKRKDDENPNNRRLGAIAVPARKEAIIGWVSRPSCGAGALRVVIVM
jgi:hypothetical protein